MAKVMLVEDDTNLSEIYQARLTAEGYDIVSAHDGEEALALAAKEKPDLIVSDVMMPKISGFEMLDILRNTEGLKETKVIMLTALGQADDKTRADSLGADRYLVKSQVTLEDIVKAAQELLTGTSPDAAPATAAAPAPTPTPVATPVAVAIPPAPTPMTVAVPPQPVAAPSVPVAAPPVAPVPVAAPVTVESPMPAPVAAPVAPTPVAPVAVAAPPAQPAPLPPAPQPAVPPAPAPVVAAPTPMPDPPPAPAPPSDPTTAADNKLVSDAVDNLMEGLIKPGIAPVDTPVPASIPAPAPIAPPTPAVEADPFDNAYDDSSNSGGGSHKKVIKPISDDPTAPKPSLESLLADEERKNSSTTAPAPNTPVTEVPHQPGHIITPSAAESLNNGSGIDPNSIAL
jgi:CheY-like chemotaxis protein